MVSRKLYKSYTSPINANSGKMNFLESTLSEIANISEFIFNNRNLWDDQSRCYKLCREKYPSINSKILQNFIKLYSDRNLKKLPKKPIKAGIYLDQDFNIVINDNKFTTHWLRFCKSNYPLTGKYIQEKITDPTKVKTCHIYKKSNKIYCRLVIELEIDSEINNKSGNEIDLNSYYLANVVKFSKNLQREKEKKYRKKNVRNFIHELTSNIIKDFQSENIEVLYLGSFESVLELVKNMSRGEKSSKGRALNKFPYKLFRDTLSYKCQENGIKVVSEEEFEFISKNSEYAKPGRSAVKNKRREELNKRFDLIFLEMLYPSEYHALFYPVGHPEYESYIEQRDGNHKREWAGYYPDPNISRQMLPTYYYFHKFTKKQMEEFFDKNPVGIEYERQKPCGRLSVISFVQDLKQQEEIEGIYESENYKYNIRFNYSVNKKRSQIIDNILQDKNMLLYSSFSTESSF